MRCPLCERDCPENLFERHHLQTRRADKKDTESICRDCHKTIHGLFSNTELRNSALGVDSVEGLLANGKIHQGAQLHQACPPRAVHEDAPIKNTEATMTVKGWAMHETIAMPIYNPRPVTKMQFTEAQMADLVHQAEAAGMTVEELIESWMGDSDSE